MIKIKRYYLLIILFLAQSFASTNNYMYNDLEKSKINLIYSDLYTTDLSFILEDYQIIPINANNNKYKVIIDYGTPILDFGKPDLPKFSTSIIIPDNIQMSLKITNFEYEEIYNINIAPSKGNLTRDINPNSVPFTFGKEYKEDVFYPNKLAELSDPFIIRDVRGQGVLFYPIQYNPYTKTLRIYNKIEVSIESNGISNLNTLSRSVNQIQSPREFNYIYENLFINANRDTRFEYLSDEGKMLIICYDEFIEEMQPLVNWKNKKGIYTEIIGISEIGSDINQIQDYINDYYYEYGLTYLLLVGDIAQIPTHMVSGAASDPSFGFIVGDDSFAEVIVGRFSGSTPSHIETQVSRTIEYERNPLYVDHFNNALGIASNQGPGYGGLTDAEFNDLIWNDFLAGYTYDNFEGIYDPNGSVSDGVLAINNGIGIINYTGHSGITGWGNGAPLSVSDVNNLTNTNKLPFIFTVGCNPGEFNTTDACFCEAWMRATDEEGNPTGSVAHFGSTISQSWEPPMHGQWAMNAILTESYDENITRSYGGIAVNGCMHMNEAQGSYGVNETNHWTIFGDPSIIVRTDSPMILNVEFDENIFIGQDEFIVNIETDGALVALSSNNQLLSYAYSIGGEAALNLDNISNIYENIDLVITSFNFLPIEEELSIIAPDGPYIVYDSYEIVNDSNFNDYIEYGDEIQMNLLVENIGTLNTNAILVNVSSSDSYITMINENTSIAYAVLGQIAQTESPISFSISNDVPDGHLAQFEAILFNDNGEWNINFGIEIHSPVFEIENPELIDDNMDGVWESGESVTLNVDLVNSGSASFNQYPGAIITTDNEFINIISDINSNTFFGIGPNSSYQGSFVIESDILIPLNTEVDFNISWGYSPTSPCEEDCVLQANLSYSTIVGHPSILIWDPSDNHLSGNRLVSYFNDIGYNGYTYIDTTDIPITDYYSTAFIFLGMYPENYILHDDEIESFLNIIENGGNIYLEGGDTWIFDNSTSLHGLFGIIGEADGAADLSSIIGIEGTFTENLSFEYNGGNNYVDRLLPGEGFSILQNIEPEYITAVAYDNVDMGYRTIGSSHELGGLQGDGFTTYIESILNFFEEGGGNNNSNPECSSGDLNNDEIIDVIDIVAIINIILNEGVPPTEFELCAADINMDNIINILDVLVIINIIIDNPRDRSVLVDEVTLILDNNRLDMDSNGPIKGIEYIIETNGNLIFNEQLNMNLECNHIDNLYHCLIYSLNGSSFPKGKTTLFESEMSYNIKEILIVNSANELVDIAYDEILNPSTFVLQQNYPNPFNPSTTIEIEIGQNDHIELFIYDIYGKEVAVLAKGYYSKGKYSFNWNGNNKQGVLVSSGLYIYSLIGDNQSQSKSMMLLK